MLLGICAISLGCAVLLGQSNTKAAPEERLAKKITTLPNPQPSIAITRNPFVSFVIPHKDVAMTGTQAGGAANPTVIGAPQGYVPNPAGNGSANGSSDTNVPQLLILCDTWTAPANQQQNITPTAVFVIGTTSYVAVAGDIVGGYKIRAINKDNVSFDSGQTLGYGDCAPTSESAPSADDDADAASATMAPATDANAPQPMRTFFPQQPGSPNQPQSIRPSPAADDNTNRSNGAAQTYGSNAYGTYGNSSVGNAYGNNIYGSSAPTPAPGGVSPFGLLQYPGAPR
jgi:hypothetical protein